MLDCIAQVAGKVWATPDVVGNFVQALNDLLQPQAHLCSGGRAMTDDQITGSRILGAESSTQAHRRARRRAVRRREHSKELQYA